MNHNFTKFDYANMRTVNICIITIRPIKAIKTRNRRQSDSFASCILSERGFPCNLTNNRIVVFPIHSNAISFDISGNLTNNRKPPTMLLAVLRQHCLCHQEQNFVPTTRLYFQLKSKQRLIIEPST